MRRAAWTLAVMFGLAGTGAARAADSELGTWVSSAGTTSLIIQARGQSRRLIYHVRGTDLTLSVDTNLDGRQAPVLVNGEHWGGKIAIRRVDAHHFTAEKAYGGVVNATFDVAFSDDFESMTVRTDLRVPDRRHKIGLYTEVLTRKQVGRRGGSADGRRQ